MNSQSSAKERFWEKKQKLTISEKKKITKFNYKSQEEGT